MEINKKTVNDVYLNTWAKERFVFTDDEYQTLYNLAIQRPVISGDAVYSARVMIGVEGSEITSARLINPENNSTSPVVGKIYPNPTKDEAYLDYQLQDGQHGLVSVYSITGQLLYEQTFDSGKNRLILNLTNYQNGIYFYRVEVEKMIVDNGKLMIIR